MSNLTRCRLRPVRPRWKVVVDPWTPASPARTLTSEEKKKEEEKQTPSTGTLVYLRPRSAKSTTDGLVRACVGGDGLLHFIKEVRDLYAGVLEPVVWPGLPACIRRKVVYEVYLPKLDGLELPPPPPLVPQKLDRLKLFREQRGQVVYLGEGSDMVLYHPDRHVVPTLRLFTPGAQGRPLVQAQLFIASSTSKTWAGDAKPFLTDGAGHLLDPQSKQPYVFNRNTTLSLWFIKENESTPPGENWRPKEVDWRRSQRIAVEWDVAVWETYKTKTSPRGKDGRCLVCKHERPRNCELVSQGGPPALQLQGKVKLLRQNKGWWAQMHAYGSHKKDTAKEAAKRRAKGLEPLGAVSPKSLDFYTTSRAGRHATCSRMASIGCQITSHAIMLGILVFQGKFRTRRKTMDKQEAKDKKKPILPFLSPMHMNAHMYACGWMNGWVNYYPPNYDIKRKVHKDWLLPDPPKDRPFRKLKKVVMMYSHPKWKGRSCDILNQHRMLAKLDELMDKGIPCLIDVVNGTDNARYLTGNHYVVVYGRDESGRFMLLDPGWGRTRLDYGPQTRPYYGLKPCWRDIASIHWIQQEPAKPAPAKPTPAAT